MIEMHPMVAEFYNPIWEMGTSDFPYPGLHTVHFRDRLRSELSQNLDHPITWNEIMTICNQNLGVHEEICKTPPTTYAWAFTELSNAWLITRFSQANRNRIFAVAQALGQLASADAAFGSPHERKTYEAVLSMGRSYSEAVILTEQGTDDFLASVIRAFFIR